ncbi:hypothetical protein ACHAXT_001450 [Thalassiosira profunda]
MSGGGASSGSGGGGGSLAAAYPVNTLMELKLTTGDTLRGLVYCTDAISNSVVLKRSLVYTTLSSEITVVNAASVAEAKAIDPKQDEALARELADAEELKAPLPNVSRKALEERERRAVRLAEESFGHVNQKASPEGQKAFDKLLKACNEVVWRGESILVLKEIRVDPPYKVDNCTHVGSGGGGGLNAHSLERVKKIVAAAQS